MKVRIHREKPDLGNQKTEQARWLLPFWAVRVGAGMVRVALSRWTFLDVLEYLEGFSVLIAVIFYFPNLGTA